MTIFHPSGIGLCQRGGDFFWFLGIYLIEFTKNFLYKKIFSQFYLMAQNLRHNFGYSADMPVVYATLRLIQSPYLKGGAMKLWFKIMIIGIGLLATVPADALERFDIITTQELEQMLVARKSGELDFMLVNSLDEIIALNASIPGSINIPWSRIDETIHRLGDDKDKQIIVY